MPCPRLSVQLESDDSSTGQLALSNKQVGHRAERGASTDTGLCRREESVVVSVAVSEWFSRQTQGSSLVRLPQECGREPPGKKLDMTGRQCVTTARSDKELPASLVAMAVSC